MTIEEFIENNWKEYCDTRALDIEFKESVMIEWYKFWIKKAKEFYQPKLEWQPAETAPKDGRYFLAYRQDGGGKYFRVLQIKKNSLGPLSLYDENSKMPWSSLGYLINWLPLSALPPIPEEKKELVFEAGKYYKCRNGNRAFVGYKSLLIDENSSFVLCGEVLHPDLGWAHFTWTIKGKYLITNQHENDLISEWEE